MPRQLPVVVIVMLSLLGGHQVVWGQVTRSQSSSGLFGTRSVGGGTSAGNRTFGGSGNVGERTTTSQADVGSVGSSDRFVRGNRQAGEFVGSDSADAQAFLGAIQAGANALGQSSSGLSPNRAGNANRGGANRSGRTKGEIRTSLRVAFDYSRMAPLRVSSGTVRRLLNSPKIHTLSEVDVLVRDGTAILRGVVATQHDRDLAERLTRLEAGIWDVKNELVVARAPVEPQTSVPTAPAEEKQPGVDTPSVAKEPAAVPPSTSTPHSTAGDSPVAD